MIARTGLRTLSLFILTNLLLAAGCGGGGGGGGTAVSAQPTSTAASTNDRSATSDSTSSVADSVVITGSVGDGPVQGATVTVTDADDRVVAEVTSDEFANFSTQIPSATPGPLRLRATGGVDLVTGRPLDFPLMSIAQGDADQTANISPLTTFLTQAVECGAGTSQEELWQQLRPALNFGLSTSAMPDPVTSAVDSHALGTFILVNEAVGEWIRRTQRILNLSGEEAEQAVAMLACSLVDGAVGAQGDTPETSAADRRLEATASIVAAAIRIEVIAGALRVDGEDATARMNDAARQIMPDAVGIDVRDVVLEEGARQSAVEALSLLEAVDDTGDITSLRRALETAEEAPREATAMLLTNDEFDRFEALAVAIATADAARVDSVLDRRAQLVQEVEPTATEVASTEVSTEPAAATSPVNETPSVAEAVDSTTIDPEPGAGVDETPIDERPVEVARVNNAPALEPEPVVTQAPPPSLAFDTSAATVDVGSSVTLNWSATDAQSCVASGGWVGNKPVTGSETIGPLSDRTTLTLECSGSGGTAIQLIEVVVQGELLLRWVPPTQNTDGTEVNGLSHYLIYYGQSSRNYDGSIEAPGGASEVVVKLPVNDYYIAAKAVSLEGVESEFSNEVIKSVR